MTKTDKLLRVTGDDGGSVCTIYIDDGGRIVIDYGAESLALSPNDWKDITDFVCEETP